MIRAGATYTLAFMLTACQGSEPERRAPSPAPTTSNDELLPEAFSGAQNDIAQPVATSPPALPASCLLLGADEVERGDRLALMSYFFLTSVRGDCRTRRLTQPLSVEQTIEWGNYLFNYSSAIFGCGVMDGPIPGGVDAFGLVNTDAIGIASPAIGPADASALIELYMAACRDELDVNEALLEPVRAHLESAGARRAVASLEAQLSDCAEGAPAPDDG